MTEKTGSNDEEAKEDARGTDSKGDDGNERSPGGLDDWRVGVVVDDDG